MATLKNGNNARKLS